MLATGARAVSELGLTVSLEHLSFERIIQDAEVSRASVYRRWPYKDLFFADLMLALAESTDLEVDERPLLVDALESIASRREELRSDGGRRDVFVWVLRHALGEDLDAVRSSPRWQTYVAINATFAGLPDGELRTRVGDALKRTERRFTAARSEVLARVVPMMGYRLVDPLDRLDGLEGYRMMAYALGSTYTGLVIRGLADPEVFTATTSMRPFGISESLEWTVATYVAVTSMLSFITPDTAVVWDDDRIAALLEIIDETRSSETDANAVR